MSIYRIDANLPRADQIEKLNSMILELEGKVEQGKFDKTELDNLFTILCADRKFYRNTEIGNTVSTYTGWSHLSSQSGYSIWKYSPTNYEYNSLNQLYFDNQILENRGEAGAESATTFNKVFLYDGSTYTDNTTEAGTAEGTEFTVMVDTNDYLYVGDTSTFAGIYFEWQTRGSNYTLVIQYWIDGTGWVTLTTNTNSLDEDTNSFESNGKINWNVPSGWSTSTINGSNLYWIRISTTTTPVTTAKAYRIIPYNSVISLLALSSTQFQNEDWAWCSYGSSIYTTIRNTGNASYEGDYYVTSSSSSTNKENFFVHNHEFTIDYEDNTYNNVITKTDNYTLTINDGIIILDAQSLISGTSTLTATLPSATSVKGKRFIIGVNNLQSGTTVSIETSSGQTISASGNYIFASDYEFVTLVSDGNNYYIINRYKT